jgi:hypothetical protein
MFHLSMMRALLLFHLFMLRALSLFLLSTKEALLLFHLSMMRALRFLRSESSLDIKVDPATLLPALPGSTSGILKT